MFSLHFILSFLGSVIFPGSGVGVWLYGIHREKTQPSPDWEQDLHDNKWGCILGTAVSVIIYGSYMFIKLGG